jgi:4-amino-4-deoxy-L-arabinose transferase-like glycosyltransferase
VLDVLESRTNNITLASMGFVLVAGAALAIREGSELPYHDEREYLTLADNLVDQHRYTLDGVNPTAYKPPVWPLLLAVFRWLGSGVVGLRLVNVALLAVCVLLGSLLARRIAGQAAGSIAAVLIAVFPVAMYTATTLYPQILGAALLLGGVLAATAIPISSHPRRAAIGTGACFGLLILTVPSLAVIFLGVLAWLWVKLRPQAWPAIITVIVITAVLPLGWAARNTVQMDALVPIATVDGVQFLYGNNENARPDTGPTSDTSKYGESAKRRNLNEVESARYYKDSAMTWIRENPGDAASLYVGKLIHHFGYRDKLHTASESSRSQDIIVALTYYPLLLLVALRFALARRFRVSRLEVVIVGWYLANAFVTGVFFPRIRYRVPADMLLIAEVAVAVVVLAAWFVDRRGDGTVAEELSDPSELGAVHDRARA